MEVTIIRKVELSMDEQKKYEVIKALADHPHPNKQRAAITLDCTVRHVNRMLKGYREQLIDDKEATKIQISPSKKPGLMFRILFILLLQPQGMHRMMVLDH